MRSNYFIKLFLDSLQKSTFVRRTYQYIEAIKYFDNRVWSHKKGNQRLYDLITSNVPCAIGKLGSVELGAIRKYISTEHHLNAVSLTEIHRQILFTNAGVFPNSYETLAKFTQLMSNEVLPQVDGMVVWFNYGESAIVKRFCSNFIPIRLGSMSSYLWENPWTRGLSGKKILVVTPFTNTIQQQYKKRTLLWPNQPEVLPEFMLDTMAVPLSPALVAPKNVDWFETLELLKLEMSKRDFDIALIGAGAYSLPLAVYAKSLGRIGIHTGGETQFFFGVKGGRWDKNDSYSKYYNEHWVRPSSDETPQNSSIIESGCYW